MWAPEGARVGGAPAALAVAVVGWGPAALLPLPRARAEGAEQGWRAAHRKEVCSSSSARSARPDSHPRRLELPGTPGRRAGGSRGAASRPRASRPGRKSWPEPGQRADVRPAMCALIGACTPGPGAAAETLPPPAFLPGPQGTAGEGPRPGTGAQRRFCTVI